MTELLNWTMNHSSMIMHTSLIAMLISMVSLMSLWFRLNRVNRIVRWLIFNSLSVIQLVSLVLMLTSTLLSTFQHIHTHAQQNLFFVACILFAAVLRLDWIFVQNFWQWLPDPKEK